jgi:hypothetical protein
MSFLYLSITSIYFTFPSRFWILENLPLSRIQEEGAEIGENNFKGQFHKTHVH